MLKNLNQATREQIEKILKADAAFNAKAKKYVIEQGENELEELFADVKGIAYKKFDIEKCSFDLVINNEIEFIETLGEQVEYYGFGYITGTDEEEFDQAVRHGNLEKIFKFIHLWVEYEHNYLLDLDEIIEEVIRVQDYREEEFENMYFDTKTFKVYEKTK